MYIGRMIPLARRTSIVKSVNG
uniref:Uncharacterized protein n=1 Tax=Rhizophora mucronata TaxID=61149 RepID=A0A2P2J6F5_RHIMU